ncbi:MAG: oligosaccharide flippase family protein [Candidatus Woesebacteria bacterium]|jgi:O-antigen/teichoic acid export membrane protein
MIKRLLNLFSKSQGLKQSGISIVGNTFATGFSAIALMLISRQLGPELFGEFSVGFSIVMISNRFNDFGLSIAILKLAGGTFRKNKINAYFSRSLKYRLIASLFILLVYLIFSNPINNLLKLKHTSVLLVAIIFGFSSAYYEQLSTMLLSLNLVTKSIIVNLIQALSKLFFTLAFLLSGIKDVLIYFTAYVLSPCLPVLFSKKLLPEWVKIDIKKNFSKESQKIQTIVKHSSVSTISSCLVENIDILFVQAYLSSYETGLLGGTSRIAMLFSLIAGSLGQVLFPRVAKYKDSKNLKIYLKKAFALLVLVIFGFFIFVNFSKYLIIFTIGEQYLTGLNILIILLASSFITVATVPFIALFYSFKANWYFSLTGLLQLVIIVIGNAIFVPKYGLEASAITRLVARLVIFLFTLIIGFLLYKQTYHKR